MVKIKNCHIFNIGMFNIFNIFNIAQLIGWAIWQKLPVNNFESNEDTFQFNENVIKK